MELVLGPASSEKSKPCWENFDYLVTIDIRDDVKLEDVMDEHGLGPNGGLLYCMEHLEDI
ncbi:hypothetical protein CASFOL_000433 [Castilleja foliolosa]|uniref:GPN-loop GTPase 3 n=1 Tax=Castilleja foliolosa TaxID=1961234 RepID=A0ABD3EP64_9LAMI